MQKKQQEPEVRPLWGLKRKPSFNKPKEERILETVSRIDPPPLNWSTVYFSKRRIEDGNQTTQTGRNCLEAASS